MHGNFIFYVRGGKAKNCLNLLEANWIYGIYKNVKLSIISYLLLEIALFQ